MELQIEEDICPFKVFFGHAEITGVPKIHSEVWKNRREAVVRIIQVMC